MNYFLLCFIGTAVYLCCISHPQHSLSSAVLPHGNSVLSIFFLIPHWHSLLWRQRDSFDLWASVGDKDPVVTAEIFFPLTSVVKLLMRSLGPGFRICRAGGRGRTYSGMKVLTSRFWICFEDLDVTEVLTQWNCRVLLDMSLPHLRCLWFSWRPGGMSVL